MVVNGGGFLSAIQSQLRAWVDSRPVNGTPRVTISAKSPTNSSKSPVIGLALGGGFARGIAHLGVLRVLQEQHIPIHLIGGTSAGSIIAGAYASGRSLDELMGVAGSMKFKDFARWTVSRMGLASSDRMKHFLERSFLKTTFEQLRSPLAVVATDLMTGEPVVFSQGDLIEPVRASCAYPGIFPPVKIKNRLLIDGAISGAVPVAALRQMGATHVIAVHLDLSNASVPTNMFQLIGQCFSLMQARHNTSWRQQDCIVIEPDVGLFNWDDFGHHSQMIALGEVAARAAIPKIHAWLKPAERLPRAGPPRTNGKSPTTIPFSARPPCHTV